MNWVGGSRNRCMRKDDTSKLRAFFQKQRMKRKSTSEATQGQNAGNMDLLSLFIANQLASKKEQTSTVGKPVTNSLLRPKITQKSWTRSSQFPKRSCPSSSINLGSGQLLYSVSSPDLKIRKHRQNKEFQLKLSPLVESNMSDGSGSENRYQPSSSSAGFKGAIKAHAPFTQRSTENTRNVKITTQPTMLKNPWLLSDPAENILQNSPEIRFQFESTSPNPEMGEHSETSALFSLSCLESGEDIDLEVFASQSSCDRSENLDKVRFFSTQTESSRHDGNSRITLDAETQTTALSTRDVSVQCSPLYQEATRRQSFHEFLTPIRLCSSKHRHRRTRSIASKGYPTNQQAQTHPKSQPHTSFPKLRSQKNTKTDLTSNAEDFCLKASEEIKQKLWYCRVNVPRCDSPRSENVLQDPVKDVSNVSESVKEMKISKKKV